MSLSGSEERLEKGTERSNGLCRGSRARPAGQLACSWSVETANPWLGHGHLSVLRFSATKRRSGEMTTRLIRFNSSPIFPN